ncbi:MAG TPA: hypothetical protein PLO51_04020 [Candidatus Micrarchaeota archaeon]|nr:hypothetical protein [Candidatus Micrarchaeota archaeon]
MGNKKRGRERLINCDSCGARVPRDKAVSIYRSTIYSTDLKTADDVRTSISREFHYCPSCGKHKRIYEKKKEQAARAKERRDTYGGGFRDSGFRGGFGSHPRPHESSGSSSGDSNTQESAKQEEKSASPAQQQ